MKKIAAIALGVTVGVSSLGYCAEGVSALIAENTAQTVEQEQTVQEAPKEIPEISETYLGADFSGGQYEYVISEVIYDTINTLECWIRMEKNEYNSTTESVIFSNWSNGASSTNNNTYTKWCIDSAGRVNVSWLRQTVRFYNTDVRTGEWVHLAIVRDKEEQAFKLYIDGELDEVSDVYIALEVEGYPDLHRVGNDVRETDASPKHCFNGEIGQLTCYTSTRTAGEVKDDYENSESISAQTRANDLILNYRIQHGDTMLYDTSVNCNHAEFRTNDYYYDEPLFDVQDYSLAVVGDVQEWSRSFPGSINSVVNWTLEHQQERKIASISFLGDLTDGYGSDSEATIRYMWKNTSTPIRAIGDRLAYNIIPGNHDYKSDSLYRDLTIFNEYFPYEEFAAKSYYGGSFEEGQTQNYWTEQTLGGIPYIFLMVEMGAPPDALAWFEEVIRSHPNHRVVIMTHAFLTGGGERIYEDEMYLSPVWYFKRKGYPATGARTMWEQYFAKYDNVFMILCGHSGMDTIAYKQFVGEKGNTVMVFRIDPSFVANFSFDPLMALFQFNETEQKLYLNYFSADKNMLYNIQNQKIISFEGFTRYTADYYKGGNV